MIGKDIAKASQLLSAGHVVAIPTETVYGLAGNALNPQAINDIYRIKKRPKFNPLILHVSSLDAAREYVTHIPLIAEKLANLYWPGSLSILLPKNDKIPDIVTAGSPHVVIRIPDHSLTLELLRNIPFPLVAPSANISNRVSPTQAKHVTESLGERVPYILDGGQCQIGLESTIIGIENNEIIILRQGGITQENIQENTGLKTRYSKTKKIQAPGQLTKHYATKKPLYIVESIEDYLTIFPEKKCTVLLYTQEIEIPQAHHTYYLSTTYQTSEIANQLFSTMRKADKDDSEIILIEPIKLDGIGRAIDDRLKRAATKIITG